MSKLESSQDKCTNAVSMESQLFSSVEQNDRTQLRELILSNHCDPRSVRNERNETLLHVATKHGLLDIVRTLVEVYQLCPLEIDQHSLTSCHIACIFQHLHILAYFLQIGGYTRIRDLQPLHIASTSSLSDELLLHILESAASSHSVVLTRFVYTCLYYCAQVKVNLFYDSFSILTKLFSPEHRFIHRSQYLYFAASCCGDNLNMLKFFLDELLQTSPNEREKLTCYSRFIENAYRQDNADIVSYLTKNKGVSPNLQSPLQSYEENTLQPWIHYSCVKQLYSALHTALYYGNLAMVQMTIASSPEFYCIASRQLTTDHGTVLHSVCVSGKLELIKLVMQEFHCNINTQNKHGDTPLHVACEWGWLEIVEYLVLNGGNVKVVNNKGYNPLTLAIKHSRKEIFKFLCSRDISINVVTTDTNETPLHLACCCHDSEFAFTLLNDKRYICSLDAVDKFGDTPLFNSCRLGNIEVVMKLVTQPSCSRLMVNHITQETPAHIACRNDRLDILKVLLVEGLSEPFRDLHLNYLGESLLHIACYNDYQKIIDFLLENKISNITSSNSTSESFILSPIHIACSRGNKESVEKLLKSRVCKVTDKDKNGNNILHYICQRQQINDEIMTILAQDIEGNKMLEWKNDSGDNALHFIIKNDGVMVLHTLSKYLSLEAINNALCSLDARNNTPLHLAFAKHCSSTLKYLLDSVQFTEGVSKAMICTSSFDRSSPLHVSCNTEYIQLFLKSPLLSKECISQAVNLQNMAKNNFLHNIVLSRQWNCITSLFQTLLECVPEADIMSILCMKNQRSTPLQSLLESASSSDDHDMLISDILFCLAVSPLKAELVKEICSAPNSDSDTLLHMAVSKSLRKTVKVLVEHHMCDPDATNSSGKTSLHYACMLDEFETAVFLCENGCDVHTLDHRGTSPVVIALINGKLSLLEKLLSKGYCHPLRTLQRVKPSETQQIYCYFTDPYPTKLTVELPLLHSMVYHGCLYNTLLPFIAKHKNSLNLCDSFGNTIIHLKSSYHLFVNNLVEFSDCDLNIQNKEGNTPLHIACAIGHHAMIRKLVESDKCSKSLSLKNKSGHTPVYYLSSRELINLLVLNGADPKDIADTKRVKHLTDKFKAVKSKHPLNLTVTGLVLGNSQAGKTTLLKSLTKAYGWDQLAQSSVGQVEDKCERTAGIEISEYEVNKERTQRVLFYDFAGHPEFHSTHSILLQNRLSAFSKSSQDSPLLFVIVIDITASNKLKQLMYWTKFIQNCHLSGMTGRKPEVVIIGSHVDKYSSSDDMHRTMKHSLNLTMEQMSDSVDLIENPILLNCCEPNENELQKLQLLLMLSTEKLEEHVDLDNRCHLIFSHLYDHYPEKPVKFSELQRNLRKHKREDNIDYQFTTSTLKNLLLSMHDMHHILLIGPTGESSDFWILTAKAQNLMFHKVQGLLFAGEDFDQRPLIESNVGVISSSELKEMFPDFEYEMLQQFLVYSEFCKKIDDEEVLKLIQDGSTNSKEGQAHCAEVPDVIDNAVQPHKCIDYFFFPGLVKELKEKRKLNLKINDKYSYCSGWLLQCAQHDFLNPLFLQVLLLRMTFQFATTGTQESTLHRRCIIWKNGVFWSASGVEMLVEVTDQNQTVLAFVRCFEETELEAVKLRSAVLKEVNKVKAKHSPATKVSEFIVFSPTFDENGLLTKVINKVLVRDIAVAITKGTKFVQDESYQHQLINKDLLCFEPYTIVDAKTMTYFFDPDLATDEVADDIVSDYKEKLDTKCGHSKQFKDQMMELKPPVLYKNLRDLFDQYSIFHGRDPKDLQSS